MDNKRQIININIFKIKPNIFNELYNKDGIKQQEINYNNRILKHCLKIAKE